MASPGIAIVSILQQTGLVGNNIYPNLARIGDGNYPMIVFKVSDVSTTQTYTGTDPLASCKVELAAIALTYGEADAIAWALVAALDNSSGTWGGVTVQGCFLDEDGISDDDAQETASESLNYFIKTATFTMWFVNVFEDV
jgi:Protein of unknown function (DUF3168)